MQKPPLYAKLWVWMLLKANWRDRDKLKRGQFVTSIHEMQAAMTYNVGFRKMVPTKDEIRAAYEWFSGKSQQNQHSPDEAPMNPTMITTTKTTRGMIITIVNYDTYQNLTSYEPHTEPRTEDAAKPTATPHDTERIKKKESLSIKSQDRFDQFYQIYPRHQGKQTALKAWAKFNGDLKLLFPIIMGAVERQKNTPGSALNPESGPKFIPLPSSWLNGRRWEDETEQQPRATGRGWL